MAKPQGPGYFGKIASTLKDRFGLNDEQVAFWTVHDVADEDHSDIGRELLDQFATSEADLETVLRVVRGTVGILTLLEDDTWRCMQEAA